MASLCLHSLVGMDYNAAAVQALRAVDRYGYYSSDGIQQGFVVRKGWGMRAKLVGREQVFGVQGESGVMGQSILEKCRKGEQQVVNTVTIQGAARALKRTSYEEMEPIVVVSVHACHMRRARSDPDDDAREKVVALLEASMRVLLSH